MSDQDLSQDLTQQYAQIEAIVGAIEATKGEHTVVLDVRAYVVPTSFMVITTADNPKQLKAIGEEVQKCLDVKPYQSEGADSGQWMVVDYGSVIVHVMSRGARKFYELDELWEGAAVDIVS